MVVASGPPTIEAQIAALPADALYEIVDGEVIEVAPMGMLAGAFANWLAFLINTFVVPRKIGFALVEAIYRFGPGRPQRRPDVSFIAAAQWPANLRPDADPPSLETVPSLAVEVISPSNTAAEIEEKKREYFDAGVKVVWIVHPIPRTIYVFGSLDDCRVVNEGGVLDRGSAIPGFQVKVAEIFACMFPTPANAANGMA